MIYHAPETVFSASGVIDVFLPGEQLSLSSSIDDYARLFADLHPQRPE